MENLFIGRKTELQKLKSLYDRKKPTLAVVKGRRRIGKSRFVLEFANQYLLPPSRFFNFTAMPPTKDTDAQSQRDHFISQLRDNFNIPPPPRSDEWSTLLHHFAKFISPGDIILFDEISWMGSKDPNFVGKLKAWWDVTLEAKDHLLLVFCGSVSTWIEENILKSTAFLGRVSLRMTLKAFLIPESAEFLKAIQFKGSPFEIYRILCILGGIPWYLDQINPKIMADENIKQLCFMEDSLLSVEFKHIFHDIFNGKGTTYKKILDSLKEGTKTIKEIREAIQYSHSGTLSLLMEHLITAGFVTKYPQWSFKTEKYSKQSLYAILDPYSRFYLKNIEPHQTEISKGSFNSLNIANLPEFDSHMGLQFENLLIQNRSLLLKALGIDELDCVFDGPYRQTKTLQTKGCQIDYLVQTKTKNLFLCEFKSGYRNLGNEIIKEVEEKMKRLSIPRGFALVPVLFHLGEVSKSVEDKQFFYRVIDVKDFLK